MNSQLIGWFRKIQWPQPLAGFRGLKRTDLPREVAAGFTLAALVIPLNIGYAQVAGLSPVVGLYAGILPLAVFALLTSSRHVVSSPDASMAALIGAALLGMAVPADMRLHYALAVTLMCGFLLLIFWYFRLAFLANFLSRPVLVGFFSGLGIEVFANQSRNILDATAVKASEVETVVTEIKESLPIETEGFGIELIELVNAVPEANLYSVTIGVSTIVVIRLLKRYTPKLPGALVALVLATIVVGYFNLDKQGVGVLGKVALEVPRLSLPKIPSAAWLKLIPSALAVACITLCEGLMVSRRYSQKYGYKADGNQVLFSFGMANITAGLTGAFAMGNSPSRAAAMDSLGSRSQLPSLVAAGAVTLVLLFFADSLAFLPNAALAGIVANAVMSLIDIKELRLLYRMRRADFWIAMVCLFSVLVLGPLRAIIIAFLLTAIEVVRRASRPYTSVLQEAADGSHLLPGTGNEITAPALIVYRFGAPLYFANANLLVEQVEQLVIQSSHPIERFVLDAQAMVDIDTTGAEALKQVLDLLDDHNITFALSRASRLVQQLLRQYGLFERVTENRLHATNRQAIAAFSHEYQQANTKDRE